jgi:hypothetical protein
MPLALIYLSWQFVSLAALTAAGCDGPPRAAEDKVKVTVVAILATDRNKEIDPRLECIAREVQKMDQSLTGFRLAQLNRKSVAVGATEKFKLVDKETADVVVVHGANAQNRVSLKVKPPQVGEIDYTSCCGKFFPIITRYQTKDKDRLIIAIMVKPCKN